MDVTIQSQIQSPLVRTLQSIPTNSANFVHGIPDNTPPFSKSSFVVDPDNHNVNDLNSVVKFKIPQNGRLSRMHLNLRMMGHQSQQDKVFTQGNDNPLNFAQSIEWVELRTHNNVIERLYPSNILFQALSLAHDDNSQKHILQGMVGYRMLHETRVSVPENPQYAYPLRSTADVEEGGKHLSHQDFIILLPFSVCNYMKDNLQTRMMEDLELYVKTKPHVSQAADTSFAETSALIPADQNHFKLTLDYINFHENVEEVIRNENFKPNIPASILSNDSLKFKATYHTKKDVGGFTHFVYRASLSCDALVTSMYINAIINVKNKYTRTIDMGGYGQYFKLTSGNEVITEGTKMEYDGIRAMQYSTVQRQYQSSGVMSPRYSETASHIRFGINNTDEFFDGGISFQSLIDPVLEITVVGNKVPATDEIFGADEGALQQQSFVGDPTVFSFDVVLKRKVLLRIDGNTGKIQKSLES